MGALRIFFLDWKLIAQLSHQPQFLEPEMSAISLQIIALKLNCSESDELYSFFGE